LSESVLLAHRQFGDNVVVL